jgi:hypothetical protein
MATAYYIYYHLRPGSEGRAQARVKQLRAALLAKCGISGRLLTKRDAPHLWMEVYERVQDTAAFEAALAEQTAHLKLEELVRPGSTRQLECFLDASECA